MNTITMPGFNAEASLHKNSVHYQIGVPLSDLKQGREIVPSQSLDQPSFVAAKPIIINGGGFGCRTVYYSCVVCPTPSGCGIALCSRIVCGRLPPIFV